MTPHYTDESVTLYHGKCEDILREMPDNSVDAVVTDPPYGLEFMGKSWDRLGDVGQASHQGFADKPGFKGFRLASYSASANLKCQRCDRWKFDHVGRKCECGPAAVWPNVRAVEGRRMQDWHQAWAAECLRVLKPGGHLLAFGGSRTWHRLAAAVEDAGFEIRDSIAWLYGSGFPKSLDVSKAIDKRPGVTRHAEFAAHLAARREAAGLSRADVSERVVGTRTDACWNWEHHQFPEAKWWPALRELLDLDEATWGPVIAEAERQKVGERATGIGTGKGAVPIMGDGNRDITTSATEAAQQWQGWGTALKPAFEPIVVARKPLAGTVAANVLEHGTGALNIDGCRVAHGRDVDLAREQRQRSDTAGFGGGGMKAGHVQPLYAAAGRWPTNVVLDESQAADLDKQSNGAGAARQAIRRADKSGMWGLPGDGQRYGDEGGASRFFPTFRYEAKAPTAERPRDGETAHPTVKPLDLMRWLVRLVTPPGGTVLEPFAGSGTTAEACVIEGFKCIAIEREADYLPLIVARLTKPIQIGLDFGEAG
jgi:DNA modification methylase